MRYILVVLALSYMFTGCAVSTPYYQEPVVYTGPIEVVNTPIIVSGGGTKHCHLYYSHRY